MPQRKLTIAYYTPSWPPGAYGPNGIVRSVDMMRQAMRARGHDVHIITATCPAGYTAPDVWRCDVSIPMMRQISSKLGLARKVPDGIDQLAKGIAECIRRIGDVDIFEIEESFGLCGRVNTLLQRQGVCRLRGPWYQSLQAEKRSFDEGPDAKRVADETHWFRACEFVTAPTKFVLDDMLAFTGHTPEHHQAIFNPAMSQGARVEERGNVRNRILFVGRIDRRKGADLAIEAFGRVADRFPAAEMTVVGPDVGVERDGETLTFTQLVERFVPEDARGRIHYKGALPPDEIVALRNDHGITLVPSRYENQPNVLSEAMIAGSAAICAKTPYTDDIFLSGNAGLDFVPGSADSLTEQLSSLLADHPLQAAIGARGAEFLAQHLDANRIAEQTEEFWYQVVASRDDRHRNADA